MAKFGFGFGWALLTVGLAMAMAAEEKSSKALLMLGLAMAMAIAAEETINRFSDLLNPRDRAEAMAGANAFVGILPSYSSGASSSSAGTKEGYEVFINHRGPDTKDNLALSIYDALKRKGVRTFLDKYEIQLGDPIPSDIQEAMNTSFLHIAIISPTYANSPWCLAELAFMLKTGKKVIPLFYNVEPSDLRWIRKGKGMYAKSLSKHKARYRPEIVLDWKLALERVSHFKGHIVKNEDDKEALKTIEDCIMNQSENISFVPPTYPVGFEKTMQDFERTVGLEKTVLESSENVKFVGITGMGGSGKTTLVEEYYNKMKHSFYRRSFIYDIQDQQSKTLLEKQKKMFQDLRGSTNISFDDIEEGKARLAERLRLVKVFVVLDNVDHQNQLDALLPIKNSLTQGSIIVVTSRDPDMLISWGIPSNFIYKMKDLDPEHAMELFCWHAFQQPSPIDEFEYLVKRFLKVGTGLPLSLKVLGALVHGKSKEYWNAQLEKFSRSLHKDIKDILMVSFDALDEDEKEVFLDISNYFVGKEISRASAVWPKESGWSGAASLETLKGKCLIEVHGNCLGMHELLRDLGRDISKTRSPCRLFSRQQIAQIRKEKEIISIRGMIARTDEFYEDFVKLVTQSSIKIMDVENNYFTEELGTLSESLVYLRWDKVPHGALPSWISLKKLRVLELLNASKLEEVWSGSVEPPVQLRVLNIIQAENLQRFPRSIQSLQFLEEISLIQSGVSTISFSPHSCPNLDRLFLKHNHELVKIDSLPISVKTVIVRKCSNLQIISLNRDLGVMRLQHLEISYCEKLEKIQGTLENGLDLTNLQVIELRGCRGLTFPTETLALLTGLHSLLIAGCAGPTELIFPPGSSFSSLNSVQLYDCGVSRISISPHSCPNLYILDLQNNDELGKIDSLPISVKMVIVCRCSNLQSLNCGLAVMRLRYLGIFFCEKLKKIQGLENCSSLESLNLPSWGPDVPVIQGLKDMENLRNLSLTATCHISAFEACLKSLDRQKWPSECVIICARAVPGVEGILKSLTCPGLTVVDSFNRQKTWHPSIWEYVFLQECSHDKAAAMMCVVINSQSDDLSLDFTVGTTSIDFWRVKEGKCLWIGVFTQSSLGSKIAVHVYHKEDQVEMGLLVMGEKNSIINAFYELVQHL